MLFVCSNDNCSKQLKGGVSASFHGNVCFKCGGELVAATFHRQGVEYDLSKIRTSLDLDRRGGIYAQKDVAEMCGEDSTYVSRMLRGERPMKDNLADTLISLILREGFNLNAFIHDGSSSSLDEVAASLNEKEPEVDSFPLSDALKVQESTRKGAQGGEVEATFGFRRLKLWQRSFLAFLNGGAVGKEALGASYWVSHAYKLDDEGQLYAAELFQRIFGFDPVKPTEIGPIKRSAGSMEHPMEPVAKLLAESGFHLYAYGETGDGKSFATERVARSISRHEGNRVAVVSGHEALSTEDFIASGAARGDGAGGTETFTELRTLPLCMKRGMPLVMDEPCVVRPSILMALQRVLETGELHVPEADLDLQAQPGFRVFLTDNTRGLAEDPRYATRRVLDEAFRDRFLFLHFDSMPEKMATAILEQDASQYGEALSSDDEEALEDSGDVDYDERQTEIVDDESEDSSDDNHNWAMLGIE